MTSYPKFITKKELPRHQDWLDFYPRLNFIVAVSKTQTNEAIIKLFELGYHHFGENKAQELKVKAQSINRPITWHFIGTIQSNKIRDIVSHASWIHSVTSLKHLEIIQNEAQKINKMMNVLIQLKLTDEQTKQGLDLNELPACIALANSCSHTKLKGFMVMGPNTDDEALINAVFKQAETLFMAYAKENPQIRELSMGMSHDFNLAYLHKATLFRIGSLLFSHSSL